MEDLTTSMHELGIMAQKEAIAMRIITVVTVIFLPATFVSVSFIRPIQDIPVLQHANHLPDILQHRYRQIPKWRGIFHGGFGKLVRSYNSINLRHADTLLHLL